jgi:hypothetical protein
MEVAPEKIDGQDRWLACARMRTPFGSSGPREAAGKIARRNQQLRSLSGGPLRARRLPREWSILEAKVTLGVPASEVTGGTSRPAGANETSSTLRHYLGIHVRRPAAPARRR